MDKSQFFLITSHDGRRWLEDEVVEHTPIPRVRQLLGGRWETTKQYEEFNMRVFYNGRKRVLVLGFPPGKTRTDAMAALRLIHEGREDLS